MSSEAIEMKERNYGIDALRILSMAMIVVLHILGQGGVLKSTTLFSINYNISWLLEVLAYGAVNCYALISGYVGINSTHKYRNILQLWFHVFFYTVGITMVLLMINPEWVSFYKLFQACFPVLTKRYWYFTAYFCLFFITPILNFIVQNMERKNIELAIFTSFMLFSIFPTFTLKDQFLLNDGYSFLWLAFLYVIGGHMNKYNIFKNVSSKKALSLFFVSSIITWLCKMLIEIITIQLFGEIRYNMMFVKYISPTVLFSSIMLFVYFTKVDCNKLKKVIRFISPLSFGVYLIHVHPLVWNHIMLNRFSFLAKQSPVGLVIGVIVSLIVIYTLCLVIEYFRFQLFKKLKVKEISLQLEKNILRVLKNIQLL